MGLLEVLIKKFKPQNNKVILSLQYFKLIKEESERGYLTIKVNECKCKENNRRLKEQVMEGINDKNDDRNNNRIDCSQNTSEITRDHVLAWTIRGSVQREQKSTHSKEFNSVTKHEHRTSTAERAQVNRRDVIVNVSMVEIHINQTIPRIWQRMLRCGKVEQFKKVYRIYSRQTLRDDKGRDVYNICKCNEDI